jgi:DNA-binding NtrC family response regulator
MQGSFTILVTDTNRHVRDLLCRELALEGYDVVAARDGRELMARLGGDRPPDLIILDPDLQDAGGSAVFERLREGAFSIPVVVHGFAGEYPVGASPLTTRAAFIEKTENTDGLKQVVRNVLLQFYADRCESDRLPDLGKDDAEAASRNDHGGIGRE